MERHSRKCAICTHPDRQALDEAFLDESHNPQIVKDYNLPSLSSLYRHAHATGLWLNRVRAVNRLRDCEGTDSARQKEVLADSNRESGPTPADETHTPLNPNRENKPPFSDPAQIVLTVEIQRMLIGKRSSQ